MEANSHEFMNAIFEIADFIDIYEAFKLEPANRLQAIVSKLQKGVNGPINSVNESINSSNARNLMFEVVTAARAHRPQCGVETILDAESDTGIKIENKKSWVECKRIASINSIEKNTAKASEQLEVLLKNKVGSGHRGIVAIDITKILDPKDRFENDAHLEDSADRIMDQFIEDHSHIWQRVYDRRQKKVIGTIIRFSFMTISDARRLRVHATQWAMNPRHGISASDDALLRALVTAIK